MVVLQRPRELELAARWLGGRRRPGRVRRARRPRGEVPHTRHHLADRVRRAAGARHPLQRADVGLRPGADHGDRARRASTPARGGPASWPGSAWSSTSRSAGAGWSAPTSSRSSPGSRRSTCSAWEHRPACPGVTAHDLPQAEMHAQLARRRVYVHPFRWTSLGLSLVEAMHLGMPVVALATTEAVEAVPPAAGACSNRHGRVDRRRAAPAVRPATRRPRPAGRRAGQRSPATAWPASCTTGTDFSRR